MDEVLGSLEQELSAQFILQPCQQFLDWIDAPDHEGREIVAADLVFDLTNAVGYAQQQQEQGTQTDDPPPEDAEPAWMK